MVTGRGRGSVNVKRVNSYAHSRQSRAELFRAGRAVRQTSVGLPCCLELPDELDGAGEGVFLVVDGAVEVEQDTFESIQIRVHGEEVYWRDRELKAVRRSIECTRT